MMPRPGGLLRSVLYVPATNQRARAKLASLACDAAIIDLEDAVGPADKATGRASLAALAEASLPAPLRLVIRVNPLSGEWGLDDLKAAAACRPEAILLPKVATARDILDADEMLDEQEEAEGIALWAMIETPRALLNCGAIAELGRDPAARLSCLVAGTNDLVKETGLRPSPDRNTLVPWLLQLVLAARAGGLDVLDGVSNDYRGAASFEAECAQAAALGFDGKTLIHPDQIAPANAAFSPTAAALEEARAVIAAFALPENAGRAVVSVGGRMVERLHLEQAEALLARATAATSRTG